MRIIVDLKPAIAIIETDRDRTRLTLFIPGDAEVAPESVCVTLNNEGLDRIMEALGQARRDRTGSDRKLKVAP